MPISFLDTNILLRYLTRDDEKKAQQALNLLLKVERGEEKVAVSPLVVFETIFTLQTFYKVPRHLIKEQMLALLSLRNLHLPEKNTYFRALELYIQHNISFADAFNAAYMLAEEISQIYSWDRDFDKLDGVIRVEPNFPDEKGNI